MPDRYLRAILTVIAIELLWIGVKDIGSVSAQSVPAPTPVIIKGIDIADSARDPLRSVLPVAAPRPLRVEADRPIPVISAAVLKVEADRPIPVIGAAPFKVETDRLPLKVESVGYTPGQKPGE